MAKENVKKFFEEVSKNADLQKQLTAATEKNEAEIAKAVKEQAEAVASVAKGAGFDFTAEELIAVAMPEGGQLDQSELDAVAGGYRLRCVSHGDYRRYSWCQELGAACPIAG